ncbi:MAG: helix-turn-helix domain-containing protein [Clostridia bacterium]|nr:helix-turn-helix domain-containing protein [Clostridia bacterium]
MKKKDNDFSIRKVEHGAEFEMSVRINKLVELNEPKFTQTVHWHDHFELEILDSGSALHLINGETYKIHSKNVYLLTPSDIHTLLIDPAFPMSSLCISAVNFNENTISEELFNELMSLKQPIHISLDDETYESFKSILILLKKEREETSASSKRICRHLFSYIVLKFIAMYHEQTKTKPPAQPLATGVNARNLTYINKAISYIKYNFRDPELTTKKVAQAVFLTPNYFGEVFHKHMGISCLEYIKKMKLDFGMSLLIQTDLTVADIAERSGYSSISYFISDFKAEFGLTPQKYRAKHNAEHPHK